MRDETPSFTVEMQMRNGYLGIVDAKKAEKVAVFCSGACVARTAKAVCRSSDCDVTASARIPLLLLIRGTARGKTKSERLRGLVWGSKFFRDRKD